MMNMPDFSNMQNMGNMGNSKGADTMAYVRERRNPTAEETKKDRDASAQRIAEGFMKGGKKEGIKAAVQEGGKRTSAALSRIGQIIEDDNASQRAKMEAVGQQAQHNADIHASNVSDAEQKDIWGTADQISQLAQMVHNYSYTYKEGFGEDPTIEHTGPMAQELELVPGFNECVIDTPMGKQVDTGRLCLVLTGIVSDLSRKVIALEQGMMAIGSQLHGRVTLSPINLPMGMGV